MSILMFLIGMVFFTFFISGQIWELKQKNKEDVDYKNYYERHTFERKKNPKTKTGSQSRLKNYNWK